MFPYTCTCLHTYLNTAHALRCQHCLNVGMTVERLVHSNVGIRLRSRLKDSCTSNKTAPAKHCCGCGVVKGLKYPVPSIAAVSPLATSWRLLQGFGCQVWGARHSSYRPGRSTPRHVVPRLFETRLISYVAAAQGTDSIRMELFRAAKIIWYDLCAGFGAWSCSTQNTLTVTVTVTCRKPEPFLGPCTLLGRPVGQSQCRIGNAQS